MTAPTSDHRGEPSDGANEAAGEAAGASASVLAGGRGAANASGDECVIDVRSPSLTDEIIKVARAVVAIGCIAAIAMTAQLGGDAAGTSGGKRAAARPALPPNLIAFAELGDAEQRMVRRCLEGLSEAEEVRSRTGSWPTVEELAARGVPPFAVDPIDRAGYRWQRLRDGALVNYLGVPTAAPPADGPAPPSLLILALEPDPGTPFDPNAVIDESHHKLRDGTLLHVSISLGTARTLGRPVAMPAFEDGWRTLVLIAPHSR